MRLRLRFFACSALDLAEIQAPAQQLTCSTRLLIGWLELPRTAGVCSTVVAQQVDNSAGMTASHSVPNNLGPTLMIVLGACMTPLVIGIPIVIVALAQLRTREGHRTYGHLISRFGFSLKGCPR